MTDASKKGMKPTQSQRGKKKNADPTLGRLGSSWTSIMSWMIQEDYNSALTGTVGIATYNKMRRSDAMVFATLLACELPIRSTKRFIDASRDENDEVSEQSKEVASFVEDALFKQMSITWDSLLTEILTFYTFGFSLFEKVYTTRDDKVILESLSSRKQSTILKRQTSDWYSGVQQQLMNFDDDGEPTGIVDIPSERLVRFTFRQEGDNYEGVSLLRSAYKHRRYKDQLYKFDAVKHERQSVGIPVIYPASGAKDSDLDIAQDIVENIRANESGGIIMPWPKSEGREIEMLDMKGASTSDLRTSINHHNREISKNVLAQFLELGNTESWSRALSEDQSDLFLLGLTAVANYISDIFNRYVIPELVDLNFDVQEYPHLKFNKLGNIDFARVSTAISTLAQGGIIKADDRLETHIRDLFDLPSREEEVTQTQPTEEAPKEADPAPEQKHSHEHEQRWHFDEDYRNISQMFDNKFIIQLQNETADGENYAEVKKKWLKINEYESRASRPLTFAERKVNFDSLNRSIDTFQKILEEKVAEITIEMKTDLLAQVKRAVESNDIKAVGQINAKYSGKLSSALSDVQKEMFEIGKKTAAVEMNVQVPPTKKEVRGALRVQNDNIIAKMKNDLDQATKTAVLTTVNNNAWSITAASASTAISAANTAIDQTLAKIAGNLNTLWLVWAINLWRATIYERYPEKIYWFQYSAILDENTTDYCASLDGRVVEAWSPEFYAYMPPKHYNCRSVRVEILLDETFKPKFTGIPSSIPAPSTVDTFKNLKWPIVLKNSPAVAQIKSELQERKDKLAELEKLWLFPNRQDAHKERIDQLEKSLKKVFFEDVKEILTEEWIRFKESLDK